MICQSCGMPLKGYESSNKEYCEFCFKDGKFTDEGITMEEKIQKNIAIAVKMGMDKDKAEEMANSILPALKRWKK